jgi:glycosyltransferase involved in cell wall biosynthesis
MQISAVAPNYGLKFLPIPGYGWCATTRGSLPNDGSLGFSWSGQMYMASGLERKALGESAPDARVLTDPATGPQPLVSIIIPYFNHPAYLPEAVESAKQQTYPNLEIIVIDDGSAIPADSLLEASTDIVVIRTENGGVSSARNIGFQNSSGEYLIFLDADDRLMRGAVEAHLKAFESNLDAGMTFGPARVIDGNGNEILPPKICRPRKDYFPMLLECNPIACPGSTMIRRQAFIDAGFFDLSFRNAEDYHLYLRLARLKPVVQLSTCVVDYRKHSGGKSNDTDRMVAAVMRILDEVDRDQTLSSSEYKTLHRGRKRWLHAMRPKKTLGYRLRGLYYSFRAMLRVPIRYYFRL